MKDKFLRRSPHYIRFLIGFSLLTGLWASGCSKVGQKSSIGDKLELAIKESSEAVKDHRVRSKVNDQKVRWDGGGVILGDAGNRAFTTRTFREHVTKLLSESQVAMAQQLVKQFPDIALEVLQEADLADHEPGAIKFIARQYDSNWCRGKAWEAYVTQLERPSRKIQELEAIRRQFWIYLKKSDAPSALKLGLVKALDPSASAMLQAECHRLEAIAFMMNGQHREAAQNLKRALTITDAKCDYQSSKLRLLLGEFYRHQRQHELWKKTWANSVMQHSRLMQQGSYDPEFWNRAAYLRPSKTNWPEKVIGAAKNINREHSLEMKQPEANIWAVVGFQNGVRGEGQNAVLAFKKAEATCSLRDNISNLRLQQARAMIQAGQPGPASAILIRLISQYEGHVIADRCKAILASMKLQNGGIAQGLNLLQTAVETIERWPKDENLRARADYGLALLMRGHESEGIRVLSTVFDEFEARSDIQQAHQCLWNIAKYYQKRDKREQYRTATAKLSRFEKSAK